MFHHSLSRTCVTRNGLISLDTRFLSVNKTCNVPQRKIVMLKLSEHVESRPSTNKNIYTNTMSMTTKLGWVVTYL